MRIIKESIWIGWKIESNWTDPFIFFSYIIVKPLAYVIIIGLIFLIGSEVVNNEYFSYSFIGAVFFIYPLTMIISLGYLIHEDRAKYEVLKNIYIAPNAIKFYIIGRALASAINASVSVIISIVVGGFIFSNFGLGLDLELDIINYLLLIISLILGIVAFSFMGMILTSINLLTNKLQFSLSEYSSGILFLFSGVVFPPTMLPEPLYLFSYSFPTTHFLELVRVSLNGSFALSPLINMIITTSITIVISIMLFNHADNRARELGIIDRKAEY
ncbi:MAG: ABC transporter permease [Candidatus Nitrosocaldaceae archaeon]